MASVPNTLGLDMFVAVAEETVRFLRGRWIGSDCMVGGGILGNCGRLHLHVYLSVCPLHQVMWS